MIKKRIKSFLKDFIKVLKKPEMTILPGQLAYFFVLAIVPTVTLVSVGAAFLNLRVDVISEFLSASFSPEIADMILSLNSSIDVNSVSFIIVMVLAYYIASNGAVSIIVTSNTIYGIKNEGFVQRRIKAFIMILILLLLFLFLLLIPMFGDTIKELFNNSNVSYDIKKHVSLIISVLQGPIMWCILFLFAKLLYTMAPDRKIDSSYVNFGSTFTATFWMLITFIFSIYINNYANYDALYGNLANLVIIMLWFYIIAYIFTIGLALNYHKEEDLIVQKKN